MCSLNQIYSGAACWSWAWAVAIRPHANAAAMRECRRIDMFLEKYQTSSMPTFVSVAAIWGSAVAAVVVVVVVVGVSLPVQRHLLPPLQAWAIKLESFFS